MIYYDNECPECGGAIDTSEYNNGDYMICVHCMHTIKVIKED